MVKRTAFPAACAAAASLVASLAACSGARSVLLARAVLPARVQSAFLVPGRLAGPVTLLRSGPSTWAVFADRETTSLALCPVPALPAPDPFPPPRLLDKIDTAPPLAAWFGEHAAAAGGDSLALLYTDREREDRTVLKLAWGDPAGPEMRLDVLEPAGRPVAVVAGDDGRFTPAWADASSLLCRPPSGPDRVLRAGVRLEGRAFPIDGGRGFTVYDGASAKLLWFRLAADGFESGEIEGPGPVHASFLVPGAGLDPPRLAVVSWDPATRRITLYEQQPPAPPARTAVTMSEGTGTLFVAPWGKGWLFLYDEVRRLGGGRTLSEVSLLAPDGPRYRRRTLSSGEEPVQGFSAALDGDSLVVAVLRGGLTVLRVTPPPGRATAPPLGRATAPPTAPERR